MPLKTIADLEQPKSAIRSYLNWAEDLGGLYSKFIEEDDENVEFPIEWHSTKGRKPGIHASEISGCQRPTVYSINNVERDGEVPPAWKKRFRMGHLIHGMLQNDMERMAKKYSDFLRFKKEVVIAPELQELAAKWGIHSSCDGVFEFTDQPDGPTVMRVGVELKSASADEWQKIKEPLDYHYEQCTLYMAVLDLPLMWTFYFNKSNQNVTPSIPPYLFTFDHSKWNELEKRFQSRLDNVAAQELPERVEGIKCEFCPFRKTCGPNFLKKKEERAQFREQQKKRIRRIARSPGLMAPGRRP